MGGGKTTTVFQEQYIKEDARLEYRTEQVAEQRFVINVEAFQARLNELIPHLSQQVQDTTEMYLQAMMNRVQQSIHENFISQLRSTVASLQQDLTTRQSDANRAAEIRGELETMDKSVSALISHLQD